MKKYLLPILAAFLAVGCSAAPSAATETTTTGSTSSVATNETKTPAATESTKTAPSEQESTTKPAQTATKDQGPSDGKGEKAVITTSMGVIEIEFLSNKAPNTIANFRKLAKLEFYDNTKFHRIIKGFMIQGGDPNTKPGATGQPGTGGPGYQVKAEFNDTKHLPGIVSMARSSDPDSAGSQFFIVHEAAPHLDGGYTAFGRVIKGMDVVNKIANVETDGGDAPLTPVVVKSIRIVKK
jgi:peptidyl-prolyl cis-trans isomerase B (cyclophilin B)